MRILYAIQGTGNGHLARATDIVPELQKHADVDILVSGTQGDLSLPFEVKYRFYGMSFHMGKGGVNFFKTIQKFNVPAFLRDIIKLPVNDYDLVMSDFEPVSAWACLLKGKECIGISHQNAVLHKNAPKPDKRQFWGEHILKYYAPTPINYGFHFKALDSNNFTPIIRSLIRNATIENKGHYTVYLPAYSDKEILNILRSFPDVKWDVFSKPCKTNYQVDNIRFNPVSLDGFTNSFVSCNGILTTAGFETPAEALFMGKKLFVVPMKNQYEQTCNAAFLKEMGVPVVSNLMESSKEMHQWLTFNSAVNVNYSDNTSEVLTTIKSDMEERYFHRKRTELLADALQLKLIPLRNNRLMNANFFPTKNHRIREYFRHRFYN